MAKNSMDTPFEDAACPDIPNLGKKGGNAKYDTYAGTAESDSAADGYLGGLLTEVTIPGGNDGGDQEIY